MASERRGQSWANRQIGALGRVQAARRVCKHFRWRTTTPPGTPGIPTVGGTSGPRRPPTEGRGSVAARGSAQRPERPGAPLASFVQSNSRRRVPRGTATMVGCHASRPLGPAAARSRHDELALGLATRATAETVTERSCRLLHDARVGRWLEPARRFAKRHCDELASRPTWLFSSGPLGEPPRPSAEHAVEINGIIAAVRPRDHRLFAKLDRDRLSFAERAVVLAVRATDGAFRDWDEIRGWAASIGDAVIREHTTGEGAGSEDPGE